MSGSLLPWADQDAEEKVTQRGDACGLSLPDVKDHSAKIIVRWSIGLSVSRRAKAWQNRLTVESLACNGQ